MTIVLVGLLLVVGTTIAAWTLVNADTASTPVRSLTAVIDDIEADVDLGSLAGPALIGLIATAGLAAALVFAGSTRPEPRPVRVPVDRTPRPPRGPPSR
jgi:hypothetical protein